MPENRLPTPKLPPKFSQTIPAGRMKVSQFLIELQAVEIVRERKEALT